MLQKVNKVFINYEKEEQWLNSMAVKGFNLVDYSFCRYLFEKGAPGEYIYRLELLNNLPNHPESQAYIEFMEDMGIQCVATYLRWVYFRKKAEDGPFDIYSDFSSKIKHYKRITWLTGMAIFANLLAGLFNLYLGLAMDSTINVFLPIISFSVAGVFATMFVNIFKRIRQLERDKQLHE